jgi:hypothetical protein
MSEPQVCDHCPDTLAAPTFLWGEFPPGQRQNTGHCLIHMGDRHDSVVANNEETGSTGNNKQVCKRKKPSCQKKQQGKFDFALDSGPANG